MTDGQLYGSSHARRAALALDGLDDDVAAAVHHERSLPPLLDTVGVCAFTEGDDAESVHQAFAEGDAAEGVHHALALTRGGREVLVPEDAAGVVHDLALREQPWTLDTSCIALPATLDTALVRFLVQLFRTRLRVCPAFLALCCRAGFPSVSAATPAPVPT